MVARQRWAASLDLRDLRVNVGKWEPTDEQPTPKWSKLLEARIWSAPELEGKRQVLHAARPRAAVVAAPGEVVATDVEVQPMTNPELEAAGRGVLPTRRIFAYRTMTGVPGDVAACDLRAAVWILGEPTDTQSQHPCGQLAGAADRIPLLLYGHPGVVTTVAGGLLNQFRELSRLLLDVWIYPAERGPEGGQGRAVKRQIALLYPGGTVDRTKVCRPRRPPRCCREARMQKAVQTLERGNPRCLL
jgi:hypothetical protein